VSAGDFGFAATRAAFAGLAAPTATDIVIHGTRLLKAVNGDCRIAIAGSATTDMIARAVAVAAVQEGFAPLVHQAPFGAWRQEALAPNSALHGFAPDIVVLATDWRDVVADLALDASAAIVNAATGAAISAHRQAWAALHADAANLRIIQHLPAAPSTGFTGIAELRVPASPRRQIAAFRDAILEAGPDIVFLDTFDLEEDAGAWFGAKLPFAQAALPTYLARFRAALRTATGRTKKVLVLDLDNTLWGGVIGDDGLDGIVLGPESARGEAFAAFQSYAKALAARGIVLAVCSKNDPAIASIGLGHPHSILSRSDFAAFECSWDDKATGLRRISETLNLGLDALVFVDDNPAECALVRTELPDVTVIDLGEDPADFVARLDYGNWFASQTFSAEDRSRRQAYQARAQASAALAQAADLDSFLRSLGMRSKVFRADGPALARVAQLEGKTNQFNLTTRRYSETAVRDFADSPESVVLAATLADSFGDHSLVSSLIGVVKDESFWIESWLMSCRVFSRTLEQFFMRAVIEQARLLGAKQIVGQYTPSAKNAVVADLYARLGFTEIEPGKTWQRDLEKPSDDLVTFVASHD